MLADLDIKIKSHCNELIKGVDRTSSMHQLILNAGMKVIIEVVLKISKRVAGACH